jgi:hypothetical protein
MTTVLSLYQTVCWVLLEDKGFVLGVVTPQQFLDILGVVMLDFTQKAALYKNIFTTPIQAGQAQYVVPDDVMKPEVCFVGGKIIEKVTEADLTTGHYKWRTKNGYPHQWHEDNLAPKLVELFPIPNFNGVIYAGDDSTPIGQYGVFNPADNNLTMVGPAAPDITAWTFLDGEGNPVVLQDVPDSFAHYIYYGILEQIFSGENECRDEQRSLYARARYQEGISLANSIALEEMDENGD